MLLPLSLVAQEDKYVLLTQPFVERPVSMHQGQLQVNIAYKVSVANAYFESDRYKTNLAVDGRGAIGHNYYLDLRYGILDFVEFGINSGYLRQANRSKSYFYLDIFESLTVNELTVIEGLKDLTLSTTLSLPFDLSWIDLGLTGYYSIPVAEHQPEMPQHSFVPIDPDGTWNEINYRYQKKNGAGVPYYGYGGALKLRLPKFAALVSGSMLIPQKEGMTHYWNSELRNESFTHVSVAYEYLPQTMVTADLSAHYQATPWLQLLVGAHHTLHYGGWFDRFNQTYSYPHLDYTALQVGLEIMISPTLRLLEFAEITMHGKNTYSNFFIHTGLSVNLFTY